jgi:hypothetical protein
VEKAVGWASFVAKHQELTQLNSAKRVLVDGRKTSENIVVRVQSKPAVNTPGASKEEGEFL